jgi:hypothetical protein
VVSAERSYEYGTMFITGGAYDTLEAMGGEVLASPKKRRCWNTG